MTDVVTENQLEGRAQELLRFEKVMDAQAQPRDLLSLFDKLTVSVRFSDEAKPNCFGLLVREAAACVSDRLVPSLLEAIERTGAASQARDALPEPEADLLLKAAVRRALASVGLDGGKLLDMMRYLERIKLSTDRAHTIDLAIKAGMTEDLVGKICDLTFHGYYDYPLTPVKATELADI